MSTQALQVAEHEIGASARSEPHAAAFNHTDFDQPQPNSVHDLQEFLRKEFGSDPSSLLDVNSAAAACLRPLLTELKWVGGARQLAEALPHFGTIDTVDELRTVLGNLGIGTEPHAISLAEINRDVLPCLFEAHNGELFVIAAQNDNGELQVYDGQRRAYRTIPRSGPAGTVFTIGSFQKPEEIGQRQSRSWTGEVFAKFSRTFVTLFMLTLVINVLALALPLYIMMVYGQAIGAKSTVTLLSLFVGISLVVCVEYLLRRVRSRALTYLGTRIENLIVLKTFQHLIYMPISLIETASIGSQLTKLKQFEGIRDIFSGNLANALLDLPFLAIFLVAVFAIAGPLGFIPLALVLAYGVMAIVTLPLLQGALRRNAFARAARRNFLLELTAKHTTISDYEARDTWSQRYRDLSTSYYQSQFQLQKLIGIIQTLAQSFVMVAGASAVGYGAYLAIEGNLSMSALIAVTALIWRGLAPLQICFMGLSQIGTAITSFRLLNNLLRLPQERDPSCLPALGRSFAGKVDARDLSLRYNDSSEAALRSVSLKAGVGDFIAITGASGAGKSTLLKVIAGLQEPQAGAVLIDDLDIRQFDAGEIRQTISYVPQKLSLFYGSIAQNLKLAHPAATQDDVERALKLVGAWEEVQSLPEGIETRIRGSREQRFSSGFLKQISIARAFIKRAPLYILDEPNSSLDHDADACLVHLLQQVKGKATIVLASHRPSHLRLADRVIVLERGGIAAAGPPDKIVPLILANREK